MTAAHTTGRLVSLPAGLRAELIRTKHSASGYFPVVGLVLCLLQGLAWWGIATQPLTGWNQMFGWQSLYATGLVAPLTALLVALTVVREQRARDGGTRWRPLAPRTALTARALVLALELCAFNFVITVPLLLFGWAHGLTHAPLARLTGAWIALWLGSLLAAAVALVVTRVANMYVAVGLAIAGQIGGVNQAESTTWMWQPWTWPVRAILPLLGIHPNGTALDPDSSIWHQNPWIPTGMAVLLAAGIAAAATMIKLPKRRPRSRPRSGTTSDAAPATPARQTAVDTPVILGRPRRTAAVARSLRGTPIGPLMAAALAAIIGTGAIWDANYVDGLTTWLTIPLGTCLLACLTWTAQAPAWRIMTLRASPQRLGTILLGWSLATLTLVVATAAVTIAITGGGHVFRSGILFWTVGATWLVVCLWLATRIGPAAAIGTTLILLVTSVVFGSTWIANTNLWLAGPLAWPISANTWTRAGTAIALAAAITAIATTAWTRALHKAAKI